MGRGGANSFFKFTVGFTLFIALSFGVTYAVNTIAVQQEKERQTAAAFEAMTGNSGAESSFWTQLFK